MSKHLKTSPWHKMPPPADGVYFVAMVDALPDGSTGYLTFTAVWQNGQWVDGLPPEWVKGISHWMHRPPPPPLPGKIVKLLPNARN